VGDGLLGGCPMARLVEWFARDRFALGRPGRWPAINAASPYLASPLGLSMP